MALFFPSWIFYWAGKINTNHMIKDIISLLRPAYGMKFNLLRTTYIGATSHWPVNFHPDLLSCTRCTPATVLQTCQTLPLSHLCTRTLLSIFSPLLPRFVQRLWTPFLQFPSITAFPICSTCRVVALLSCDSSSTVDSQRRSGRISFAFTFLMQHRTWPRADAKKTLVDTKLFFTNILIEYRG